MNRVGFLCMMIVFVCLQVGASTVYPNIKGYQEWKNEKLQVAIAQSTILRSQILKAQSEGNRKLIDALDKQQLQLNWNIDVAKDLSVTDYFVLYLSQQNNPDRFQQAAQKMSTREVAELIEAYANTLGTSPTEMFVQPAASQVAIPAKLPIHAIQSK
ncbi:MAG: hypothetical protein ACXWC9_04040 [Pseudobdellovibrionaceae bacterium]